MLSSTVATLFHAHLVAGHRHPHPEPDANALWALHRACRALEVWSGRDYAIQKLTLPTAKLTVPQSLIFGWEEGHQASFRRGLWTIVTGKYQLDMADYKVIGPTFVSHVNRIKDALKASRRNQALIVLDPHLSPQCSQPDGCSAIWKEIWRRWCLHRLVNPDFMESTDVESGIQSIRKAVDAHHIWGLLHHGPICNECFQETVKHYIDSELNSDVSTVEDAVERLIAEKSWYDRTFEQLNVTS